MSHGRPAVTEDMEDVGRQGVKARPGGNHRDTAHRKGWSCTGHEPERKKAVENIRRTTRKCDTVCRLDTCTWLMLRVLDFQPPCPSDKAGLSVLLTSDHGTAGVICQTDHCRQP